MFVSLLGERESYESPQKILNKKLLKAVKRNYIERLKLLIKRGANVNSHYLDNEYPLHFAAERGNIPLLKLLLEQPNIAVDVKTIYGHTPLYTATFLGFMQVVKLLLNAGADIDHPDNFGRTPLHLAVLQMNVPMTKLLIAHGANVNALDVFGDLPLHMAVITQKSAVLTRLLLRRGASPKSCDGSGISILTEVILNTRYSYHYDIIKHLIRQGADVDVADLYGGRTTLHVAALTNNIEIADILLWAGVSVETKNIARMTALDIAYKLKHLPIVEMLEDISDEQEEVEKRLTLGEFK